MSKNLPLNSLLPGLTGSGCKSYLSQGVTDSDLSHGVTGFDPSHGVTDSDLSHGVTGFDPSHG